MKKIMVIAKQQKRYLFIAVFSACISVVSILIAPLLIGDILDSMVKQDGISFHLLLLLFVVYLMGNFFLWLLTYLINHIAYKGVRSIRSMLYQHLSSLTLHFYDTTAQGDIMSRFVNDVDIVSDGLLQGMFALLQGLLIMFGSILCMSLIDIPMMVVVLLSAPCSYIVARVITKRSHMYFKQQASSLGALNGYAEEILDGQKTIQAFQYEKQAYLHFQQLNNNLYHTGLKAQLISALSNPSTRIVNNIFYALIGVIGGIRAIQGDISIGEISTFLIFATIFGKPFSDMTSIMAQIQAAFASGQRLISLLNEKSEISDATATKEIVAVSGDVKFSDVSFSYTKDTKLIEHMFLDILAGSKVAIVGKTGAGKTTLVNLLMRFYELDGGSITIDGIDIQDIKRSNLRSLFGMVLQDTWLFDGSIKDNIGYGKETASLDEIIQVGKASGADTFIRHLEYGYDTKIKADGEMLSQGQKQLLSIARVMLANPPMLILDEATSNLDTYSEKQVQAAFQQLTRNRTSFVIAHRLSTIQHCDIILVMDEGRIVESGNHEDLLKQNGFYARLYRSQFST